MSDGALRDYLSEIEKFYKLGKATEHTYRGTLRDLLETLDKTISATNEPKRVKCGAPDYVVERNNLTIGYIEAKDVGISLDKIEKDEQLGRYRRALDNLILTDYVEFRWYVQGEKRMCEIKQYICFLPPSSHSAIHCCFLIAPSQEILSSHHVVLLPSLQACLFAAGGGRQ